MGRPVTRVPLGDGTEVWHGRASGYNSRGCGCDRCREWMRRTKALQALPPDERARLRESDALYREVYGERFGVDLPPEPLPSGA